MRIAGRYGFMVQINVVIVMIGHVGGEIRLPNNTVIQIPATASMNVEQALVWKQASADATMTLLNTSAATWQERCALAIQLKNEFTYLSRNAMEDGNAASFLSMTSPARTMDEMLALNSSKYSGEALYKKTYNDAMTEWRTVSEAEQFALKRQFCFAAGTLIHTKNGLVPIEQVKEGDWVLSQPETTGELAYKRVVKTMQFEDKAVWRVHYYTDGGNRAHDLIVTANHPFWVEGFTDELLEHEDPNFLRHRSGWLRAEWLCPGFLFRLADGQTAKVFSAQPIWKTHTEGVGWIDLGPDSEVGRYIDLRKGLVEDGEWANLGELKMDRYFNARHEMEESADEFAYRCTVYNFEVEDFHTYYVGDAGVWVHNTNCYENSLKPAKGTFDGRSYNFSANNQVYFAQGDVIKWLNGVSEPKGLILYYEKIGSNAYNPYKLTGVLDENGQPVTEFYEADWVKYQTEVEGGLRSKDGTFALPYTLLYKNHAGGDNWVKLGDGAAYIWDGLKKILSKTTIDGKGWGAWGGIKNWDKAPITLSPGQIKALASGRC